MDLPSLESGLSGVPVSAIRSFTTLDSTNDEAWRWFEHGAPHNALVVADEQTAGRGRLQRRWVTAAGSSLAFSLILLSPPFDPRHITLLAGLGALAACQALAGAYQLPTQVKWPNDILLGPRKAGGVLAEARWQGQRLAAVVIGIGINIAPQSISPHILPPQELNFPATCVEEELGHPVDRMELLRNVLQEFFHWQQKLDTPEFLRSWEDRLAFRGEWVELLAETSAAPDTSANIPSSRTIGKVEGLAEDGSLRLIDESGHFFTVQAGEIHLRPVDNPPPG
jgi:BirA family biotin operon repressor/biotin-[acetyl-CoA-carboxylase] ligase